MPGLFPGTDSTGMELDRVRATKTSDLRVNHTVIQCLHEWRDGLDGVDILDMRLGQLLSLIHI